MLTGEQKLAFACLLQGLRDYGSHVISKSHSSTYPTEADVQDAHIWLHERCEYVGSFAWCCGALGLDADRLRTRILSMGRTALNTAVKLLMTWFDPPAATRELPPLEPTAMSMHQRIALLKPCDLAKLGIPSQVSIEQLSLFA